MGRGVRKIKQMILFILMLYFYLPIGDHPKPFAERDSLSLTVVTDQVQSAGGVIYIELSDQTGKAVSAVKVAIKENIAEWTFRGIAPGKWAVRLYHDENDNGKLDTNFFGIPREGYGFSNNVKGRFGPPPFDRRLFDVRNDTTITINLIY